MTKPEFSTAARHVAQAFGTTAHGAIDAVRTGGDRLGALAAERWDRAFERARPQLSAETQRNATRARKAVARRWRQGMDASTAGADAAVDALVRAAEGAIERANARQQARGDRR